MCSRNVLPILSVMGPHLISIKKQTKKFQAYKSTYFKSGLFCSYYLISLTLSPSPHFHLLATCSHDLDFAEKQFVICNLKSIFPVSPSRPPHTALYSLSIDLGNCGLSLNHSLPNIVSTYWPFSHCSQ